MSSASLVEKRPLRKGQSRNIETSSTSITSAPPTTSESKLRDSERRLKEKSMRSKQRDSLPDIGTRKGNRSVRASNFELSSSANDFESVSQNDRQSVAKMAIKSRNNASNASKSESKQTDDKILDLLKMDSMEQENFKFVFCTHKKPAFAQKCIICFVSFFRKQAEIEYNELKRQVEELQMLIEQEHHNPTSEYDESITKQQYFNETLRTQVVPNFI